MSRMLDWLEKNGVLLCNQNPELPALEDLGCTWREAMELVDAHQVFYCKAYKKRTTYLSQEAYYLLKAVKPSRPPPPSAQALLGVLAENPAVFWPRSSGRAWTFCWKICWPQQWQRAGT